MRGLLFIILSFTLTVICWGIYGPVLHWGQEGMSLVEGEYARLRPFVCVGLAYFVIGVVVPLIWLGIRGEEGRWTAGGIVWSLVAGTLGALGALGIILAFTFGGKPVYVMPLVFGGAPVINAFLTIYMARRLNEIGPVFLAGLVMVVLGAVVVLLFAPDARTATFEGGAMDWLVRLLSVALVIVCWGAYGPTLHRGQAAMQHSRMRPFVCVGLAYFVVAVVVPNLLLTGWSENSHYANLSGTFWSLAAGAAGALGALGIIMAFNFGGKPVYVMPLVFGGAPVVNTLFSAVSKGLLNNLHPMFLAGLILVIAGAAMVLVFAPRGIPPKKVETRHQEKTTKDEEVNPFEAAPGDT
jgi:hypothetical protein